jgi:ferrous iron transport protein A
MERYLTELDSGEQGTIAALEGGWGMQERLRSMGLAEGQMIEKLSSLALGGPIVIMVKRTQIAIGRGMARKILVKTPAHERGGQQEKP